MKKVLFIAATISVFTLTSCYKKYTCTCTTLDVSGATQSVTATNISSLSKTKAEKECKELDNIAGKLTTRCFID